MRQGSWLLLAVTCAVVGVVIASAEDVPAGPQARAGWRIPDHTAREQQNPLAQGPALLEQGARIYEGRCEECHGRATRSHVPDGILFYQIWNGRAAHAMPAFRDRLSREDVWAVVAYMKSQPAEREP